MHAGSHGPTHLHQRIEAFLAELGTIVAKMPEEDWEAHRDALIQAKLQKDRSVADEAERFWEQISSRRWVALHCVKMPG